MVRNLIYIVLLFSINNLALYSQSYIVGKVIDSKTLKPVPFATVLLKNAKVGVLSNAEGDFRILTNPKYQDDSLIVTSIGFRRLSLIYGSLKTSGLNVLKISPYTYNLKEVTVFGKKRRLSSEVIVARALRNIKKNSPAKPFSYVSYYRDYQKDSSNYLNLNEAIIQTLDKGFSYPADSNKYRLLNFKRNSDFEIKNISPFYALPSSDHPEEFIKKIPHATVGDQYGNELFILLVHDAIRNFNKRSFSFVDTLNKNFSNNHKFSDPIGIYNGNTYLLKINFIAKRLITGDSIRMHGSIYIQPNDYSIHKLEYSGAFLDYSDEKYKEIFNIEIGYEQEQVVDSKMCLKYISFSNAFTIPDSSDADFFKLNRLEWFTPGGPYNNYPFPDMTIIAYLNRKIDPSSVKKDNYYLTIGKRTAKITRVRVSGSNLYFTVRDDRFKRKELDSCVLNIKYLKDIDGNILNKRRNLEFRQFRELFVQEYNNEYDFQNTCFIQYVPLGLNCISISINSGSYWMNTPLNSREKKSDPQIP